VISTSLGWFLAVVLILALAIAYSVPDPDAIRAYRGYSAWEHVSWALFQGAIMSLIPGLAIGLLVWAGLRRRPGHAALAVLATIVSGAILCAAVSGGGPQIESGSVLTLRLALIGGLLGGGFTGICQSLLLRRQVGQVKGWVWLTIAGWVIASAIGLWSSGIVQQFDRMADPDWFIGGAEPLRPNLVLLVAASLVAGAIVGLGQWLLLRRILKRAGWWIPATVLGWGIAVGAGLGVLTGTTLVLLLRSGHLAHERTSDQDVLP
jgi:hypothetical protein